MAAVVVANLPALLHLVTTNPLDLDAFLAHTAPGRAPGLPTIDGNAGFTAQALGWRAAEDWLHGHVPWWNPYEAVGTPLAGEMQSGAFFPPTLLVALPGGMLLLQVLLECTAGVSSYFLALRLGVGRTFATAAGVAFGLCGTFAWFGHAPVRPVAFLPLMLIGVERSVEAAAGGRRFGWRLLAVSLALAVLAGFPETAFLEILLVALWAAVRLATLDRRCVPAAGRKLAAGVATGAALSAPLWVAFLDYLPSADVGGHTGALALQSLPPIGIGQVLLPYSLGPIFAFTTGPHGAALGALWGSVGGFLSATVAAAALVGLLGRRLRALRVALGAWIALCLLRTFGLAPLVHALAAVPGLHDAALYRYADPTWELAAILLAALGLDDVARRRTPVRALLVSCGVVAALAAWAAWTAWGALPAPAAGAGVADHPHLYPVASLIAALGALTLTAVGGVIATRKGRNGGGGRRRGRLVMASALCAESVLLLGATYASAPPPVAVSLGAVHWLQAHAGTARFTTLGPIQPDYGAAFGIAEVNANDLPLPRSWVREVARLDPNTPALSFTGGVASSPTGPTPAQALTQNRGAFAAIGTRYVVESADGTDVLGHPFPAPGSPAWPAGPRLVYRDGFAEIWELPSAAPLFSARAGGPGATGHAVTCTVRWSTPDAAVARCPHPATLVRREQFMPGWTAEVDGTAVAIRPAGPGGLFQSVELPAGTSRITFTFLPPHETLAVTAMVLAAGVLVLSPWWPVRRRRPGQPPG